MKTKFLILLAAIAALAGQVRGQFIGYVSPQTVYQILATNATCPGTIQTYTLQNLGQTQHWIFITFVGGAPAGQNWAQMFGIDANGNQTAISDIIQMGTLSTPVITGQGNFPKIQLNVLCTSGSVHYSATYAGASSAAYQPNANQQAGAIDKVLFNAQSVGTGSAGPTSGAPVTPFGNSAGILAVKSNGFTAGSSLTLQCFGTSAQFSIGGIPFNKFTFPLSTVANVQQSFNVPAGPCPYYFVTYVSGGASANTFDAEYIFTGAGNGPQPNVGSYAHISTAATTTVKGTPGVLHTLTINTGGAGAITLFDLPAASCTGTPVTNQVAIITATAASLQTLIYDVQFTQGICVLTAVAMDLTVSFQ